MPRFLNHHDRPPLKLRQGLRQHFVQSFDHPRCPGVMQAKHDHARRGRRGKRHELAEIEIEGQKNAFFRRSLRKNLGVGQALQALLAQVNGIEPALAQPVDNRPTLD